METITPDYPKDLTFEKVWAMFQETDRNFQERQETFNREMKESRETFDREMKESREEFDQIGRAHV